MKKTIVAFFETESWEKKFLTAKLQGWPLLFFDKPLERQTSASLRDVQMLSPFIYSRIDAAMLRIFPKLTFITTRSTGYDHINIRACRQRDVIVSNVPVYGANTVAEHTFALILALTRKIIPSVDRTQHGDFSLHDLRGMDLEGKTLGIIGLGNIGKHVARIAKGFGMSLRVVDPVHDAKLARRYGFSYGSLRQVLRHADIVTLHVPYTKATHHLINVRTLPSFKKGSILINTSRGGICDTTALLRGLERGIFSGLGLDVLEEECFIKEEREILSEAFHQKCDLRTALEDHILLTQPNVIITPHNAFNSQEALHRILETTVENIRAFAKGKPKNVVT